MPEFELLGRALKTVFGSRNDRVIRELAPLVGKVNALEPELAKLSDARLAAKTQEFKDRLKKGEKLDSLLPEAFAACRESAKRNLGMRHFDVQLLGGIVLHQGKIAEMATGEGKTLVATLSAYLNALEGQGVHVVTVNDYLARRDARWMGVIFKALGLEVGCIQAQMPNAARLRAYRADITYGTNSEFGFDYLRDNMKLRYDDQTQQGRHHYAIVDEVDSILIDEARTPLIIAGPAEDSTDQYYKADAIVKQLEETRHYEVNEKDHHVVLTEEGIERAQELAGVGSFYDAQNLDWPHHIDQALKANYLYKKDKEYVVGEGEEGGPEIVIVDEFTGRKMAGRRWSDGLHQAVEAKEGLTIRAENQTLATITYQNFFRLYKKLSGMTGTALTEAPEFVKIYNLDVLTIPTNRRLRRPASDDLIYRTEAEKWRAVVSEIVKVHGQGRPILVGTTSVAKSELLSALLSGKPLTDKTLESLKKSRPPMDDAEREKLEAKDKVPLVDAPIQHELLNAKQHEREAHIIARAGERGAVTIATNMAGRGTDILLGAGVADLGGLHVVGTERHEARRIDNQLRGRAGRQGDPGSSQFFLSLEDDLMRIFAKDWVGTMLQKLGMEEGQEIQSGLVSRMIERVQRKMEAHNFDIRKNLLEYDFVNNEQRKQIYGWRQTILEGEDQGDRVRWFVSEVCKRLAEHHLVKNEADEPPDIDKLRRIFHQRFNGDAPPADALRDVSTDAGAALMTERALAIYSERIAKVGAERMQSLERFVLLQTIDEKWKDHLHALDYLRTGVGMRGYGQEDPKIVYRREAANYFGQMLGAIQEQVLDLVFRIEPPSETAPQREEEDESGGGPAAGSPQAAPAGGFDEDDWGEDDDDTDWDAVVRAMTAPAPAPASPAAGASVAAEMSADSGVSTATATMGAPPVEVTATPGTRQETATDAQPEYREQQRIVAARREAGRPAADPLFAKRDVDPNAPCPCGSGKKYKKCHGG